MKLGLRSDLHWDGTPALFQNPQDFIDKVKGTLNLLYVDVPWPKEIFINFDLNNLDKPFAKGNWGYGYTFRDYINFYRAIYAAGIEIVFAIQGLGSQTNPYLNFFIEYPNSAVDGTWINPNYVDPTWNGKTFLEMYAQKIHEFVTFIGIPATITFEDWRYPGYMIHHPEITSFRTALKSFNPAHSVWGPPVSASSARNVGYNGFEADHPRAWEYIGETDAVGASDLILSNVYPPYFTAMNLVGWMGAQMCAMPINTKIMAKMYWGWKTNYDLAGMKRKMKEFVLASYLTRTITPQGETCPVGAFIITYKPPPEATLDDLLEVLGYAKRIEFLKNVPVGGPVLQVPRNLGETTYPDNISPMSGYMNGKGLKPMRFVHEDNVGHVNPSDLIVPHSGRDYSANFGISFSSDLNCTWIVPFQNYTAVFHDGGYNGTTFDAEGNAVPADTTSYLQPATVTLNGLTLQIDAGSIIIFDEQGNIIEEPTPLSPVHAIREWWNNRTPLQKGLLIASAMGAPVGYWLFKRRG